MRLRGEIWEDEVSPTDNQDAALDRAQTRHEAAEQAADDRCSEPKEISLYRLYACDLWSKFGFGDGDTIGELMFDLGLDGMAPVKEKDGGTVWLEDLVLEHLVRAKLLPLCPKALEIERWGTCHNPVRVVSYGEPPPAWADEVFVEVFGSDILTAAEKIRREA